MFLVKAVAVERVYIKEVSRMKILSLAICSLGVWVVLNALVEAIWDDIVFGAIAAVLAVVAAITSME